MGFIVATGELCGLFKRFKTHKDVLGFEGKLVWDMPKPDATPRKLMDSSKLVALGWAPNISL